MEATRSLIYLHKGSSTDAPVFAVETLNVDEFFGCRFLIRATALASKEHLFRAIVNSKEFHEFWKQQDIKLPAMLNVMSVTRVYTNTYLYRVKLPDQGAVCGLMVPLWVEAFTPEQALCNLRRLLHAMGHYPDLCTIEVHK